MACRRLAVADDIYKWTDCFVGVYSYTLYNVDADTYFIPQYHTGISLTPTGYH